MIEDKLVGPKVMADILGVPISWIYQRTSMGKEAIPHYKVGKYCRFCPSEVMKFFKENNK